MGSLSNADNGLGNVFSTFVRGDRCVLVILNVILCFVRRKDDNLAGTLIFTNVKQN